jgi:serine/threonine protein kinase
LYDYWREPDGAYLVMRFIKGGNLATTLESGPLETARAATMVNQIAAGLAAAHRQGVIHRDLKPANILLDESGNAYLSDFGIAKVLGSLTEQTLSGMVFGTPSYISPEQLKSEPVTPQSDIYSLGIVLYHILTGVKPFPDESLATLVQTPFPVLAIGAAGGSRPAEQVDQVIQCATSKNPADRYADALSLAEAFSQAVNAPSVPFVAAVPFTTAVNPYKGLRAFQEADAQDFFGREALTRRLVSRLAETGEEARVLAVVGPSGSGKSSVVKAGL